MGQLLEEFGYGGGGGGRFPPNLPGFSGCLRNFEINNEPLDFSTALNASGVSEGCGCGPDVCKNGGVCYGTGQCDCSPEFSGDDCSECELVAAFAVTTINS